MTTNTKTKNTFKIGQKFNKTYPVAAAIWCNANNAHIRPGNGIYTIVENVPIAGPTTAEKVQVLEQATGLTRAIREIVLSGDVTVSKYVVDKAKEIEDLATTLRKEE